MEDKIRDNKRKKNQVSKRHSYQFYLFAAFVISALFIVAALTTAGFFYSKTLIENQAKVSQDEVYERIYFDTELINKGLEMYDTSLDNRLKADFRYFLDEYERSGGNPGKMDLSAVSEKTGDDITLYIINESYVISQSTNPDSVGLDFKEYAPYYVPFLENVLHSSGFFPERVLTEVETGLQKKFGYMPTPDNKYILEISLYDEGFNTVRKNLKYTDCIEEIADNSPYISSVRIFNTVKKEVGNRNFTPGPEFSDFLGGIIASEKGTEITDPKTGRTFKYLYVPLRSEKYGSDNSLVVELGLDEGPLNTMITGILMQYLVIGLFLAAFFVLFSVFLSCYFSDEVEEIISDISIISGGNFEHRIRKSKNKEFEKLDESINQMVAKIRDNVEKYKKSRDTAMLERDRAQTYFNLAGAIFVAADKKGTIKKINKKALEILGYKEEEILEKNFFDIILTEKDRKMIESLFSENEGDNKKAPFKFMCRAKTKSGLFKDLNLTTVFLRDNEEKISGFLTTGNDITEDIRIKKELESSLNQKNVLLREVHHRVKNNLQMIISMFDLKSYSTEDKTLLKFLDESRNRLGAMAIVHDIMYKSDGFREVNIPEYTRGVVQNVISSRPPKAQISFDYDIDDIYFDIDHSVPFGLLINELTENAREHSFKGREKGRVLISFKRKEGDRLVLTYKDNGNGLPAEELLSEERKTGLSLIEALAKQLSGDLRIVREEGTAFIIDMEEPKQRF